MSNSCSVNSVVIVGGGLSGLICARQLAESIFDPKINVALLEGRNRFGGRILQDKGVDMGASWCWPAHDTALMQEAKKLGVDLEKQYSGGVALHQAADGSIRNAGIGLSPSGQGSMRFQNTSAFLIGRLVEEIRNSGRIQLCLGHKVELIEKSADNPLIYHVKGVRYEGETDSFPFIYDTSVLILSLPPQLLCSSVSFIPPLPAERVSVMRKTPTWMANTGKVAFLYNEPFWRAMGLSGTAFTEGPLVQVWDACSEESKQGTCALAGFVFDQDLRYLESKDALLSSPIIQQLVTLFGPKASDPIDIIFKTWKSDCFTWSICDDSDTQLPFGNPLFASHYEQMIFSGTETTDENGHMNGAAIAGKRAAQEALNIINMRRNIP